MRTGLKEASRSSGAAGESIDTEPGKGAGVVVVLVAGFLLPLLVAVCRPPRRVLTAAASAGCRSTILADSERNAEASRS
jgi:hypothetical protein